MSDSLGLPLFCPLSGRRAARMAADGRFAQSRCFFPAAMI